MPRKKKWFWISFANRKAPRGSQFLGVVVIQSSEYNMAFLDATDQKLVPSNYSKFDGDAMIYELDNIDEIPEIYRNRLLTKEEIIDADLGESIFT